MKQFLASLLLFCHIAMAQTPPTNMPVRTQDYPECKAFIDKANTGQDSSINLQKCLDSLPVGAAMGLAPGVYNISGAIHFDKTIHISTLGTSPSSPRCNLEDSNSCATFQYRFRDGAIAGNTSSYSVNAKYVSFDHIVFSGDKFGADRKRNCSSSGGSKNKGGSIRALGSDLTITNSVLKNQPCYTALEVKAGANQFAFQNNLVANNGTHTTEGFWSDGLTVHDVQNAKVANNTFVNNTDVDLIFGGCQNCRITNNIIQHNGDRSASSFAAFMIYAWASTSGNYVGSVFEQNAIDCGPLKGCGFGLYLGGSAWRPAKVYGATVRYNSIANAMVALTVDGLVGQTELLANQVARSGGVFYGHCIGTRFVKPINIEPASRRFLTGDILNIPNEMLSADLYSPGCIYNHFFENPLAQNVEFLITQFYHGFLDRDIESTRALVSWSEYYTKNGLVATAKAIGNSREAVNLNISSRDKVFAAYRAILRRNPESERVVVLWSNYLESFGFDQMIEEIAASQESKRTNDQFHL